MAEDLLLKHDRSGPNQMPSAAAPVASWTPQEISDHIAFMDRMADDA